MLDGARVTIGEDVQIGPGVQLLTALHPLDPVERRRGTETAKPVTIGDGAWLASGVIVCPGVNIGADTVVGAGSVVTKDLPAGHLCFGNPCRVIREIRLSASWSCASTAAPARPRSISPASSPSSSDAAVTVVAVAPRAPSGARCGNSAIEYNEAVAESVVQDLERARERLGRRG